ncbi:hypothetical protein AOLI_G00150680 [Acnodon oligacanthus]
MNRNAGWLHSSQVNALTRKVEQRTKGRSRAAKGTALSRASRAGEAAGGAAGEALTHACTVLVFSVTQHGLPQVMKHARNSPALFQRGSEALELLTRLLNTKWATD